MREQDELLETVQKAIVNDSVNGDILHLRNI